MRRYHCLKCLQRRWWQADGELLAVEAVAGMVASAG